MDYIFLKFLGAVLASLTSLYIWYRRYTAKQESVIAELQSRVSVLESRQDSIERVILQHGDKIDQMYEVLANLRVDICEVKTMLNQLITKK